MRCGYTGPHVHLACHRRATRSREVDRQLHRFFASLTKRPDPRRRLLPFLDQGAQKPWLPEAKDQNQTVIRASGAAAGQFAQGGYESVFDGVMGPWFLPTFFEATGLNELHYAILLPSVERCVQNVTTREGNRDDEPGTRYMHAQFEQARIDARHLIIEPSGTPEEVATSILSRYRQGAFAYGAREVT